MSSRQWQQQQGAPETTTEREADAPGSALVHGPGGEHAAHRCRAGLREEVAACVHVRWQYIAAAQRERTAVAISTTLALASSTKILCKSRCHASRRCFTVTNSFVVTTLSLQTAAQCNGFWGAPARTAADQDLAAGLGLPLQYCHLLCTSSHPHAPSMYFGDICWHGNVLPAAQLDQRHSRWPPQTWAPCFAAK